MAEKSLWAISPTHSWAYWMRSQLQQPWRLGGWGLAIELGTTRSCNLAKLLGQTIFEAPTRSTTSQALHFLPGSMVCNPTHMLVNHEERCREKSHLIRIVRSAVDAGAIIDAISSAQRLEEWLA